MKTRTALILLALLATVTVSCANHTGHPAKQTEPQTDTQTIHMDDLSPITARIIDLDRESDIVTIQMANGHIYQYYGCSDYEIGDYVSAILNIHSKYDPSDDEIVKVHYSGYSDYADDNLE